MDDAPPPYTLLSVPVYSLATAPVREAQPQGFTFSCLCVVQRLRWRHIAELTAPPTALARAGALRPRVDEHSHVRNARHHQAGARYASHEQPKGNAPDGRHSADSRIMSAVRRRGGW